MSRDRETLSKRLWRCTFLEVALCSASGLHNIGVTALVKVGDQLHSTTGQGADLCAANRFLSTHSVVNVHPPPPQTGRAPKHDIH